jgi:uncharacterized membrane protein YqjE
MADTRPRTEDIYQGGTGEEKSAGRLMKEVTEDLSSLVRKEAELAKQELSSAISSKVKGAVIFAIVAFLGLFMLIFLLLAVRDGFDNVMSTWLADLATVGVLIVLAVLGVLVGKKMMSKPISAELTKKSIKEDVEWAKTLNKR